MTMIIRCHECRKRYRVPDSRAGKRVKCKECGAFIHIPPPDDEQPTAEDGTAIYRHEHRDRDFEIAVGDSENIEAISDHVEKHLGPIKQVFHELVSDMVHVDVHWVKPTKKRPWHTLVTSGMSDRPMTVPDPVREYERAELLVQLPREWKISDKAFRDENFYWPVRLLKMLARLPHEFETWLGTGHTIPNGDPAEHYSDNTKLAGALIMPPLNAPEDFHCMESADGTPIWFYNVFPLYNEEMNFKLSKGLDALLSKFDKHDIGEVIDRERLNTCRKKWFGLF